MNTLLGTRFVCVGLAAVFASGALAPVAAQPAAWLELDAVDAMGRTWQPTADDAVIDLTDATDRRLTLIARPMLGSVASLVFSVDGVPSATVDVGTAEREVSVAVASSRGDAEEIVVDSRADAARWPAGFTYHTSSDIELGVDPSHGPQLVYVAFADVAVPSSGDLVHAEVRFTADGGSSGALELTIAGVPALGPDDKLQDVEGSASGVLSALPRTATSVAWTPEEPWEGGERYATPDLTPIVREAWSDADGTEARSLALIFEILAGDGTRRAASFDGPAGRDGASPSLHLTFIEPTSSDPVALELPEGDAVLTVTAHAQAAGGGAPIASFDVTVTGAASAAAPAAPSTPPPPAADPPAPPAAEPPAPPAADASPPPAADPPAPPAAEPPAPPVAEPAPAPADPAAPPATEAAPSESAEPAQAPTIRIVDLRSRADGVSILTVVLDAPAQAEITPVVRSGTCAAPGDVLLPLRRVLVGQDGSTTEIRVSATSLRLGGFVVVLDGVPDACVPLD